jgi:hypothetical protein
LDKNYLKRLCQWDYARISEQTKALEFDVRFTAEEKELQMKVYGKDKERAERHYRLFE